MHSDIHGYSIIEELVSTKNSMVLRGVRDSDQLPVVIKILNEEYPTPDMLARFRHEFFIVRKAAGEGVVRAVEQIAYGNSLALVLEDFAGVSVREVLSDIHRFDVSGFFPLAIELAETLGRIHRKQIIHKDITPSNILCDVDRQRVQIIDFGISTELAGQEKNVTVVDSLRGSLPYISPEQTGRMNRGLDYRSDYYSLGVTFYQMLTGSAPFNADDLIGWIHCHIATSPEPACEREPQVPPALSGIVMKLMAKNAEERYQSSLGLVRDLKKCQEFLSQRQWADAAEGLGVDGTFELGSGDVSERFQTPQFLFGREKQLQTLLDAFDSAAEGSCEYVLVSGFSGVGKSALVHEVHRPIVHKQGYFVDGKFDQFQRNVPYAAFAQTFKGLVSQLLTEPEERLLQWKTRISEAVGPNGQIIIDLIPQVAKIIGKQPELQNVGATEAQNRLLYTFKKFVQVLAQKEHPLVIFLDDLQWSDLPTLKLIEYLMSGSGTHHLLLIGAYRNNEVGVAHPLHLSLAEVEETRTIRSIVVESLEAQHVNDLVAQTMHCPFDAATPLSDLIFAKTRGNPFFIGEVLRALYEREAFKLDTDVGEWTWDLKEVQAIEVTDNVVELLIQRLARLPQETREVLQVAACMGNEFALADLATVQDASIPVVNSALVFAIREGVVVPLSQEYLFVDHREASDSGDENAVHASDTALRYAFLHDRVQQASYESLDDSERTALHLRMGRMLAASASGEIGSVDRTGNASDALDEVVINIVRHFNEALGLLGSDEERRQVCELNVRAGRRAKRCAAYQAAAGYFRVARDLLAENAWEASYETSFCVHREFAEAAYLNSEMDAAEEAISVLLREAQSEMDKASVCQLQLAQYCLVGRIDDALQAGIAALDVLGVKVSLKADREAMLAEALEAKRCLGEQSVESLLDRETLHDPKQRTIMRVMAELTAPAYLAGLVDLFGVLVLKKAIIALRHGNCPEATNAYSGYSMLLQGPLGEPELARKFGRLALDLSEKLGELEFRTRILFIYAYFVCCWTERGSEVSKLLRQAIEYGFQSGDMLYAGYASLTVTLWNSQLDLAARERDSTAQLALALDAKDQPNYDIGIVYHQQIRNLRGQTVSPTSLSEANFDEDEHVARMRQERNANALVSLHIGNVKMCYLHGDTKKGLAEIALADACLQAIMGSLWELQFCFYAFMVLASALEDMDDEARQNARQRMEDERKKMLRWNVASSHITSHFVFMMDAELARLSGDMPSCMSLLGEAIDASTQNETVPSRAVANELMAKCYLAQGLPKLATVYLADAYYDFQIWGALAKVKLMHSEYGALLNRDSPGGFEGLGRTESILGPTADRSATTDRRMPGGMSIDMGMVAKAANAISSEVVLSRLLEKLVSVVQKTSGAENVFLLLQDETTGRLLIQAKCEGEKEPEVLIAVDPRTSSELCVGVVSYVMRTQENVVLGDACTTGSFVNDPFVKASGSRSVLCMPIMHQAKLVGVLYLDNRSATDAFTPGRIEVLRILSSQAAISLQNAELYQEMAERVRQRTAQLNTRNESMRLVLDNIDQGLIVADVSGRLAPERSATFDRWFERVPDTIWELITQIDPDAGGLLEMGWEQIGDGFLPVHACLQQLPERAVGTSEGISKTYALQYQPIGMRDEDDEADSILIVMTDITHRVAAERAQSKQLARLALFERLTQHPESVLDYRRETTEMLEWLRARADDVVEKRWVHTLKGASALMRQPDMVAACHEAETGAAEEQRAFTRDEIERMFVAWQPIEDDLRRFTKGSTGTVRIATSECQELVERLSDVWPGAADYARRWLSEPLETRLNQVAESAKSLARSLDKGDITADVDGGSIYLQPELWSPFWTAFGHVVRNAVDHGLEEPSTRAAGGKPVNGKLILKGVHDPKYFTLIFADDGAGVDWERLREQALRAGLPATSQEHLVEAMFSDGISSREEVTETSGRGVGLAAVRQATDSLGGKIDVDSSTGEGTVFRFTFPASSVVRLQASSWSSPPAAMHARPQLEDPGTSHRDQ